MTQLSAEQIQRAADACQAHLGEMAEVFRAAFDCELRLQPAGPRPFAADQLQAYDAPGLAVALSIGEQSLLMLIPESLPLPPWYGEPGISENNRLQTFAHELSLQVLPADMQAQRHSAMAAPSLKALAESARIPAEALVVELSAAAADSAESEAPTARILVLVPVDGLPLPAASADAPAEEAPGDFDQAADADDGEETTAPQPARGLTADEALRALRVLRVPVTVSVRLAERKVPLGQIVGFVPGALLTFNKSCEELLDLFVNNHRYCQGEAVKIGENFGLRVAKVGVTERREEHVL